MRAIVHWLLLFLLSAGPAGAAPADTTLEAGESAGVARVVDGDTIGLPARRFWFYGSSVAG